RRRQQREHAEIVVDQPSQGQGGQRCPGSRRLRQVADAETGRERDGGPYLQPGSRTVATAWAAMPSRRPAKPSFSVVVALTLTRSAGRSRTSAMRATMAAFNGRRRGASQITVTSTLTIIPPRARTRAAAW